LTLNGTGSVVVRAEQAGNAQFQAVSRSATIEVTRSIQTIAWTSPTTNEALVWGRAHPLTATAGSGLPVSFRVQSGPAFITNGTVTATSAGLITLVAEQAGNAAFAPVTWTRSFNAPSYAGERLGQWPGYFGGSPGNVFLQGTRAYVCLEEAGIAILDVSNPAAPVRLGGFDTSGNARDIHVVGNIACVADMDSGLQILDVTNPGAPVRLGGFATSGQAYSVQQVGNLAYVACGTEGLQVIDVSNPAAPVRLGTFTDGVFPASGGYIPFSAIRVQVVGKLAYVAFSGAGYFQVIDVSNPASPVRLGKNNVVASTTFQVVGNFAYSIIYGGLQVADISNPSAMRTLGFLKSDWYPQDVHVVGNLAYITEYNANSPPMSRLQVIDVSNPNSPVLRGSFASSGYASRGRVVGNFAYVANQRAGLQVIDVSNPAALVLRGGFVTTIQVGHVQVVGNLAYVADRDAGLQVIDVSNPAAPVRLGGFDTSGYAYGVQVVDNLAYVADGDAGLQVIDVSNPAAPVRLGGFDTSGYAYGVQVVDNLA
jgi:hypothetical protein